MLLLCCVGPQQESARLRRQAWLQDWHRRGDECHSALAAVRMLVGADAAAAATEQHFSRKEPAGPEERGTDATRAMIGVPFCTRPDAVCGNVFFSRRHAALSGPDGTWFAIASKETEEAGQRLTEGL